MVAATGDDSNVLILGDSASAHTGGYFREYLDLLQERWNGDLDLAIVNVSAAGMTSADALVILEQRLADADRPDAVVIYLGNCDACAFGYLKSHSPRWLGTGWRRVRDKIYRKLDPLRVRARRFEFAELGPLLGLRACVPLADLKVNLRLMLRATARRGVKVVLVNPTSNLYHAPCNNTGNFIYWKVFGVDDRHPYKTGREHLLLRAALNFHSSGDYDQAATLYKRITTDINQADESARIAHNNLGAIHYRRGEAAEAIACLDRISLSDEPMAALVLFNRALALRSLGRIADADRLLLEAREADLGTYRVRDSYRAAIADIAAEHEAAHHVAYVDLADHVDPSHYIDYCHPTEEGHERIAAAIGTELRKVLGAGNGGGVCTLRDRPANPDVYLGYSESFLEHFQLVGPAGTAATTMVLVEAAKSWLNHYDEALDAADRAESGDERWRLSLLTHPVFGLPDILTASPPRLVTDTGRMPDWYFTRHMLAIYDSVRADPSVLAGLRHVPRFVPDPARTRTSLAETPAVTAALNLEALRALASVIDSGRALDRGARLLAWHLRREPTVHSRYRTISYWFFRESLLFGSASDVSSLFDRQSIARLVDSCLLVLTLCPDARSAAGSQWLLKKIDETLDVHFTFLGDHASAPYLIPPKRLVDQRERLAALLATLQMPSGPPDATTL